jgi:hypothetical protein
MGMLFTPAPARAIAFRDVGSSISSMLKLRTSTASGPTISEAYSKLSGGSRRIPLGDILLSVWILNIANLHKYKVMEFKSDELRNY